CANCSPRRTCPMTQSRHAAPPKRGVPRFGRLAAAAGAVVAGLAVALAAYASHGAQGQAASWLQTAALFGFGHGVALAVLAPAAAGTARITALILLLAGMVLFSGSLVGAALLGWPTALAP